MRVATEPKMPTHGPGLCRSDAFAGSVDGFTSVDAAADDSYRENGFLLVPKGFPLRVAQPAREKQRRGAPRNFLKRGQERHLLRTYTHHLESIS